MSEAARKWLKLAGWGISLGLLSWFVYRAFIQSNVFEQADWGWSSLLGLALAALVYVLSQVVATGVSWWLLVGIGCTQARFRSVAAVGLMSQLGKYLPGNVAHHVGRVVLSRHVGLGTAPVIYAMFLETLWVVAVAISLFVFYLVWYGAQGSLPISEELGYPILILALVGAVFGPYVFRHLFVRVASAFLKKRGVEKAISLEPPSALRAVLSVAVYYLIYLILGLILALLGWLFYNQLSLDLFVLGSAFAVAWVVGFLTPGSPQGSGCARPCCWECLRRSTGKRRRPGSLLCFGSLPLLAMC